MKHSVEGSCRSEGKADRLAGVSRPLRSRLSREFMFDTLQFVDVAHYSSDDKVKCVGHPLCPGLEVSGAVVALIDEGSKVPALHDCRGD